MKRIFPFRKFFSLISHLSLTLHNQNLITIAFNQITFKSNSELRLLIIDLRLTLTSKLQLSRVHSVYTKSDKILDKLFSLVAITFFISHLKWLHRNSMTQLQSKSLLILLTTTCSHLAQLRLHFKCNCLFINLLVFTKIMNS